MLLELEALPLVTSVKLEGQPNDKPTNIKVHANLKAEFVAPPKSCQPKVCLSKERPTQLEAARALLSKLRSNEKGGYAAELAAAAAAAAVDAGAATSAPRPAPSAFDRLLAGRVAHQALKRAADEAEQAARAACDAERKATAARKAAEASAAEAKAALAAFEPVTAAAREAAAKRQKTAASGASGATTTTTTTDDAMHVDVTPTQSEVLWPSGKGLPPPNWCIFGSYTHATYQKLETETQRWRAVLPGTNEDAAVPSDRGRDGALHHWRRGLVGCMQVIALCPSATPFPPPPTHPHSPVCWRSPPQSRKSTGWPRRLITRFVRPAGECTHLCQCTV